MTCATHKVVKLKCAMLSSAARVVGDDAIPRQRSWIATWPPLNMHNLNPSNSGLAASCQTSDSIILYIRSILTSFNLLFSIRSYPFIIASQQGPSSDVFVNAVKFTSLPREEPLSLPFSTIIAQTNMSTRAWRDTDWWDFDFWVIPMTTHPRIFVAIIISMITYFIYQSFFSVTCGIPIPYKPYDKSIPISSTVGDAGR